jgi:hypothetical protein
VRQAALGVRRAVDRVDHHEHALVAEVHGAALLRERVEARAGVVERLELGEHPVLGGLVDDERAIAALAALAGLLHALVAGRMVGEHGAQDVRGPTASAEPVRLQRCW